MIIKDGIEKFGEKGNDVLLKGLNQLHMWQALLPRNEKTCPLTKKKALRYLMFLKDKQDSTVKRRDFADGRSQR